MDVDIDEISEMIDNLIETLDLNYKFWLEEAAKVNSKHPSYVADRKADVFKRAFDLITAGAEIIREEERRGFDAGKYK